MGLQAIFNPVVRSYFKKKYGSGGSSGDSNIISYVYEPGKEYETVEIGGNTAYKISDVPLDAAECSRAVCILQAKGEVLGFECNYAGGDMDIYDASEEGIPGLIMASWSLGQAGFGVYSNPSDSFTEATGFSKGVWAYALTADGSDLKITSYFIFHKK